MEDYNRRVEKLKELIDDADYILSSIHSKVQKKDGHILQSMFMLTTLEWKEQIFIKNSSA